MHTFTKPVRCDSHRPRRLSTHSSAYTTTDFSPPEDPPRPRQTPYRIKRPARPRGLTPTRRLQSKARSNSDLRNSRTLPVAPIEDQDVEDENEDQVDEDDERDEEDEMAESDDGTEETPLARRLRSRTQRGRAEEVDSELDEDGEDGDEESLASPGPSSRLRSRDARIDSDVSMSMERKHSRSLSSRGRKGRVLRPDSDGDSDEEGMEVNDDAAGEEDIAEGD